MPKSIETGPQGSETLQDIVEMLRLTLDLMKIIQSNPNSEVNNISQQDKATLQNLLEIFDQERAVVQAFLDGLASPDTNS